MVLTFACMLLLGTSDGVIVAPSPRWDHHSWLKKLLCRWRGSRSDLASNWALFNNFSQLFRTSAQIVVNLYKLLNFFLNIGIRFNSKGICFVTRKCHRHVSMPCRWEIFDWIALQELIYGWNLTNRLSVALNIWNLYILVLSSMINVWWCLNWCRGWLFWITKEVQLIWS
jgi:hypothetical protein